MTYERYDNKNREIGFFAFDYLPPRRWTYSVHPDDPGFKEEMAFYHPVWDIDPYDVCMPELIDRLFECETACVDHDQYARDIWKGVQAYYEDKAKIASELGLTHRYRCSDATISAFTLPKKFEVKAEPLLDFPDMMAELLELRPYVTQKSIAERIHVGTYTFSRWMHQGGQYPNLKQLMLICILLRLPAEEGLALIQSTPYGLSRRTAVETTFRAMLEADCFTTSRRVSRQDFLNDVHDLLYYSLSLAVTTEEKCRPDDIATFFYDSRAKETREFILPDNLKEKAIRSPACEVIQTKFNRFGAVRIVAYNKKY